MTETKASLSQRLRARVCQLVLTEGQLDMTTWAGYVYSPNFDKHLERSVAPSCGTACCCAGNVVIAARELGVISEGRWRAEPVRDLAWSIWQDYLEGKPNFFHTNVTREMVAIHVHTGLPYSVIELMTEQESEAAQMAVNKFVADVLGGEKAS